MIESDIEWRLKLENRISTVENEVNGLSHVLNGNGQPGFISEVNTYIHEQRGAWKAMVRIGGILAFLIMALLGWLTYRDAQRRSALEPPISIVQPKQNAELPRY